MQATIGRIKHTQNHRRVKTYNKTKEGSYMQTNIGGIKHAQSHMKDKAYEKNTKGDQTCKQT